MRHIWMQADNTSLTEWRLPADKTDWWLVRYNDAAHLSDIL
jgi:hypothetical protein